MTKTTITINGRLYDVATGMPVGQNSDSANNVSARPAGDISAPDVKTKRNLDPAQNVHQTPQRSQTLLRQALHRPVGGISRSPAISRFNKEPQHSQKQVALHQNTTQSIEPAIAHPAVVSAVHKNHQPATTQQPTGSELKEQLIKEKLAEVKETSTKKESWLGKQPKLITILSSTLALLVLGGYLTYITLPSISLKVAASRAGVNATMPEYKPDGYSIDGAISYSPGEVVISYRSNTNDNKYKLSQKATNWDSQAVLDNYVTKNTGNYLTFQERGLTVYTFDNKAVWVNGGVLYTIEGNASLSSEQLMKLATSI